MPPLLTPSLYRSLMIVAAFCAIAVPTSATITFTGENNPTGPGDGDLESTLEIGFGSNAATVDPRATVSVVNDTLEFDEAYVGSDEDFFGRLFVSGALGRFNLDVDSNSNNSNPTLQVGRDGNGYVELSDGATLDIENANGDAAIGFNATSFGRMVVQDTFTLFDVGENLVVGADGVGELEVRSGAIVRTRDDSGAAITIGDSVNSVGSVWVDGVGSVLQAADDLVVGDLGVGTLAITGGGLVDADHTAGEATVGALGRVSLDDGTLAVDTLNLNGVLGGHGFVRGDGAGSGQVTASVGARIEVGAGQRLTFNDDVSNQGTVDLEGGEIEFLDGFANNAIGGGASPGRIELEDARVTFSQGLANNGVIAAAQGASDLHGAISNNTGAAVTVARDAVATFHDPFTNNGGTLSILTGATGLFLSDLTFTGNSITLLELAATETGGESGLTVQGTASLAGEVRISLPDGVTPEEGQTYTLLTAEEITGSFLPPLLPNLEGGLEFEFVSSPTSLTLNVVAPTIPGDFNNDGQVDAADYTVWRDGFGPIYDENDYQDWVNNYGESAVAPSSSAAVPEPTAWLLLAGSCAWIARPRAGAAW